MNEVPLRAEIVALAGRLAAEGYIHGRAGNISVRLSDDLILSTPAGYNKADLYPDQLVVVDFQGKVVRALGELQPTSELPMHLEVYRQRPDVGAVIHAHPRHCIALSLVGITMDETFIPEALVMLGPVPTTPYATPSSDENREAIAGLIAEHDALILAHHGSLTVGRNLAQAYERLEVLEETARILTLAHQMGTPRPITPENVQKLRAMRERARAVENKLHQRIEDQVREILRGLE